jgi:transcriptional regulator with XRE-family HTH domain
MVYHAGAYMTSGSSGISDRVRAAAQVEGMNIKQLAERSGIPYRTAQDYLSGKRRWSAGAISQIARALNVSCDWLLTGEPAALHPRTTARAMAYVAARIEGNNPGPNELAVTFYLNYTQGYLHRFNGHDAGSEFTKSFLRGLQDV